MLNGYMVSPSKWFAFPGVYSLFAISPTGAMFACHLSSRVAVMWGCSSFPPLPYGTWLQPKIAGQSQRWDSSLARLSETARCVDARRYLCAKSSSTRSKPPRRDSGKKILKRRFSFLYRVITPTEQAGRKTPLRFSG